MATLLRMQTLGDETYEVWEIRQRSSALPLQVVSKTAAYTLTDDDAVALVDATGGAVTVTLPASAGRTGQIYEVKRLNAGANAVILDGNGAETIDGAATQTLSSQYATIRVVSDGTNWMIF